MRYWLRTLRHFLVGRDSRPNLKAKEIALNEAREKVANNDQQTLARSESRSLDAEKWKREHDLLFGEFKKASSEAESLRGEVDNLLEVISLIQTGGGSEDPSHLEPSSADKDLLSQLRREIAELHAELDSTREQLLQSNSQLAQCSLDFCCLSISFSGKEEHQRETESLQNALQPPFQEELSKGSTHEVIERLSKLLETEKLRVASLRHQHKLQIEDLKAELALCKSRSSD